MMLLSEARAIRAEILCMRHNAPAHKGARGVSRDVMRALNNRAEDIAAQLHCRPAELVQDYHIPDRFAQLMLFALAKAEAEVKKEIA